MERKGICKNVGVCTKANKVQIITDDDAEFVCPECGEPLEEYVEEDQEEKKSPKKLPLIIAAVVVVGAVVGCIFAFGGGSDEPTNVDVIDSTPVIGKTEPVTTVITDTVVKTDTVVQGNTTTVTEKTSTKTVVNTVSSQPKAQASSGSGTLALSYGRYTGATKKGYAHGQGRLTYNTTRVINRNDVKQRTAQAGDYVIGEFFNGFVVYGKHYNAAGDLLESLNFGIGSEDSYDSK